MKRDKEQEEDDDDVREASCQNPRFELAYLSASLFDEHAHEGVVASVKDSANDEDDTDDSILLGGKAFCEEDEHCEEGVDKLICHVTTNTAK